MCRDPSTKEPATLEASVLCSRLKDEEHILTSLDGTYDQVLVIGLLLVAYLKTDHLGYEQVMKPPLCFSARDVDTFIIALDRVLSTLGRVDQNAARTPT